METKLTVTNNDAVDPMMDLLSSNPYFAVDVALASKRYNNYIDITIDGEPVTTIEVLLVRAILCDELICDADGKADAYITPDRSDVDYAVAYAAREKYLEELARIMISNVEGQASKALFRYECLQGIM